MHPDTETLAQRLSAVETEVKRLKERPNEQIRHLADGKPVPEAGVVDEHAELHGDDHDLMRAVELQSGNNAYRLNKLEPPVDALKAAVQFAADVSPPHAHDEIAELRAQIADINRRERENAVVLAEVVALKQRLDILETESVSTDIYADAVELLRRWYYADKTLYDEPTLIAETGALLTEAGAVPAQE